MRKLQELQEQIQKLSHEEFAELRGWFRNQIACLKEAEDRLAAYRSGNLAAVDAEEVLDELGTAHKVPGEVSAEAPE